MYQVTGMELGNMDLSTLLAKRDEAAFEQIFKTYFKSLHSYAFTILKDEIVAEEIVQNIFYKIWEKAEQINSGTSIQAYLYRAVHNESLNYIKHLKVRSNYQQQALYQMKNETDNASKKISFKELEGRLHQALNELPQQCRTVFQKSRFEELKYRQIAEELNISVKTVENQMGKALKILRSKLVDFLPLILFLLIKS